MAFKEGEIVRYAHTTAEIIKFYPNAEHIVLIRYLSRSRVVNLEDLRKATKEDKHAHKYLAKFAEHNRKLNQYRPRDIVSYHGNIQEVYDVRGQTLILEDGPVSPSDVIPVCFRQQRLDVK